VSRILYVTDSLGSLRRSQALANAATAAGLPGRIHWFGPAPSSSELTAGSLQAPDFVHGSFSGALADAMTAITAILFDQRPELVVIAGHGVAARAAALAANEHGIPVAHADAGVRSLDPADPLDRLRRTADHACSFFFAATSQQVVNLVREGFATTHIATCGSLLASTLPRRDRASTQRPVVWLATRSDTTSLQAALQPSLSAANATLSRAPVGDPDNLRIANVVITDEPELMEAAAALGIGCITISNWCARPETIDSGHNFVTGTDAAAIARALSILLRKPPTGASPYLPDSATSAAAALRTFFQRTKEPTPARVMPDLPALPSDGDWTGRTLGQEECELAARAIRSGTLNSTKGTFVARFEREFAAMVGRKFAVACASGSAAVHCAIQALQLQAGDEVITTPITDMGALTCIPYEGGVPVFADVDPLTLNVTAKTIERQITERTRAIVITHLFGLPCDMQPIVELATQRGIPLIEDMAQALGADERSGRLGTRSSMACYSLQQGKHMTTGEGGIVTTDDAKLARRLFLFVNKAWGYGDPKPDHYFPALNYRLTELQGAVAIAQLKKLDWVVQRRREVAAQFTAGLRDVPGLTLPGDPVGGRHSWWKYAFFVDPQLVEGGAVELGKRMKDHGVFCVPRYIQKPAFECQLFQDFAASPVTRMPLEHNPRRKLPQPLFHRTDYPGTVQALDRVIVLPINELYGKKHVDYVVQVIREQARVLTHV
jgi:dTDP-4-amino-4,6-dideoxygalactose transaminase